MDLEEVGLREKAEGMVSNEVKSSKVAKGKGMVSKKVKVPKGKDMVSKEMKVPKGKDKVVVSKEVNVPKVKDNGMVSVEREAWERDALKIWKGEVEGMEYFFPSDPTKQWREEFLSRMVDGVHYNPADATLLRIYDITGMLQSAEEKWFLDQTGDGAEPLEVGKRCDIKHLLFPRPRKFLFRGRRGVLGEVAYKDIKGKYIMICCVSVPDIWSDFGSWNAALACFELYSKLNEEGFEMVIVPWMKRGWKRNEAAVDHFVSAFPDSCLTVPLDSFTLRRRIWKSIGLGIPTFLLVDPDEKVLLHDSISGYIYGADAYPFTSESLGNYSSRLYTPSSLEKFLGCQKSDFLFRRSGSRLEKEVVPVSELETKLVALYLFDGPGNYFPLLRKVDESCRKSNKGLEIVVQFLYEYPEQDPREFLECLSVVLAKRNLSWWVAPFNYSASQRLRNLFRDEAVVIFGPDGKYVDLRGANVMKHYCLGGDTSVYPFTFDAAVKYVLEELKKVTLESFFESQDPLREKLSGKNVLFYFDYPEFRDIFNDEVCVPLATSYNRLKEKDPDLEVVLVSLSKFEPTCYGKNDRMDNHYFSHRISLLAQRWLIHLDPKHNDFLIHNFFMKLFKRVFQTIVAFGTDGKICSLRAHVRLSSYGPEAFPFNGDLHEDVSFLLEEYLKLHREPVLHNVTFSSLSN